MISSTVQLNYYLLIAIYNTHIYMYYIFISISPNPKYLECKYFRQLLFYFHILNFLFKINSVQSKWSEGRKSAMCSRAQSRCGQLMAPKDQSNAEVSRNNIFHIKPFKAIITLYFIL